MLDKLDVAIGFATVMLAVSLIIMSLTQAIASALALRGARLRRGLEELLRRAAPNLQADAKAISQKIVTHPLISDSAMYGETRWCWAKAIKKEELIPVLDAVLTSAQRSALTDVERARLQEWFDTFMDRVGQWFVMNTRWITVGLAFVIAFGLHLDSLELAKQIQRDTEVKAKLGAMSAALLDQTPSVIAAVRTIYRTALVELVSAHQSEFATDTKVPEDLTLESRSQADTWIDGHAKPEAAAGLKSQFGQLLEPKLDTSLKASVDRAATLSGQLSSAGIIAFQTGDRHLGEYFADLGHLAGVLVTVLFLSLGAPFWFNTLKNLTSLRSAVAKKESDSKAGTPPAGGPPTAGAPPPPPPPPNPNAALIPPPPGAQPLAGSLPALPALKPS